jgi:hypothetical protein
MARRSNRLNLDRLEGRDLMSGNVVASVVSIGGVPELFITEAPGAAGEANAVQVSRLANGHVRVTGQVNSSGTLSHVNGRVFQDFALGTTRDLVVDLGAGDDQLRVINARFGNVFIGMDRSIGGSLDTVTLSGLKTSGRVSIDTGAGQDNVIVLKSTIGDGLPDSHGNMDDLNINTGAGADFVQVGAVGGDFVQVKGNLIANTFHDITEPDIDFVRINQTIVNKILAVDTGNGNDDVQMGDVAAADVVLVAGEGDDSALMSEVSATDKIFIAMSEGNDRLDMTFVQANNLLSVDGGTGFDRLEHHLDAPNPHTQFTGWEVVNGLSMTINPDLIGGVIGTTFAM